MTDEIERAAIALYDRFTHEGMDRRVFMAELTRIAGGAAAASALLGSVAASAEAAPQVAADDPRIRTRTLEWEARPGRAYRGYNAAPARRAPQPAGRPRHPRESRPQRPYPRRRPAARASPAIRRSRPIS